MMSLAPLRYSRILTPMGGPIRTVECGGTTVMGIRMYQANAYLDDALRTWPRQNVLYGDPEGTGTARFPAVARHMAISEALERWAHRVAMNGPRREEYGFHIDRSSNGMAAYPGLFRWQARARATSEAAERYCLCAWWAGALDAEFRASPWPDVDVLEIENPFSNHSVVVLHALADHGLHAYGFAAGRDLDHASQRAAMELVRCQYVLRRYASRLRSSATAAAAPVSNLYERRTLFFASEQGYERFSERLRKKKWFTHYPLVYFDGEIVGPWSEYTTVWRVVLEPASPDFMSDRDDFFFW